MGLCVSCKASDVPLKEKSLFCDARRHRDKEKNGGGGCIVVGVGGGPICGSGIGGSDGCGAVLQVPATQRRLLGVALASPAASSTAKQREEAATVVAAAAAAALRPSSPRMAASFNNLTIPIREIVSKKRIRYVQDGFNLDLTYITDKIIAMGFPASNIEACYRNDIEEVAQFLERRHHEHYQIYNLCSERSYDVSKFQNRVKTYPFDDHNPPRLESIAPFCRDVENWLNTHQDNVAVVHCKAGKGRTGTMICCFLLHCGAYKSAQDALALYGSKRTQNTKGVTIPSQVRYVEYYAQLVRAPPDRPAPPYLYVEELQLEPVPHLQAGHLYCRVTAYPPMRAEVKVKTNAPPARCPLVLSLVFDQCVVIAGDVKVELFSKTKIGARGPPHFRFWFNTAFVDQDRPQLVLHRNDLDILNKKDKDYKIFAQNFKITTFFQKVPDKSPFLSTQNNQVQRQHNHHHQRQLEGASPDRLLAPSLPPAVPPETLDGAVCTGSDELMTVTTTTTTTSTSNSSSADEQEYDTDTDDAADWDSGESTVL